MTIYFLIVSLDSISFSLIAPILAPLLAHNSIFFAAITSPLWRYIIYGLLIALFPLAYALSAPILGWLSDRFGRKPIILGCLILTLFAFLSYINAFNQKSIFFLALGRILAGIGGASECTAQVVVMDIAESKFKPNAVGLIAVAMTIGLALGPLIASLWTSQTSTLVFTFIIGLTVVNLLLLSFSVSSPAQLKQSETSAWPFLFNHKKIKQLLGIFLLFELGWSLYYQSVPLLLSIHWNSNNQEIGLISAYIGAALTLLLAVGTRIGLRFLSTQNLVCLGLLVGILALLASIIYPTLLQFIIYSLPITFAVAVIYPCLIAELSDSGQDHQGFIIGIAGTLLSSAFAVSSFVSSILIYAKYNLPLLMALILWTSALVWYINLGRKTNFF